MTSIDERTAQSDPNVVPPRRRRRALTNPWNAWRNRRRRNRRNSQRTVDGWTSQERRRRRMKMSAIAAVVVAAAAAVWLVWFSSVFAVKQVTVLGLSPEGEVVGVGEVQSAAAITQAAPLVRVDTSGARDRVAALPWVESVEVYRSWPNTIVVDVLERTAVAVLEEGEARRGVDATGVVFDPPGGLWLTDPVIRGEQAALAEAVAVVSSLPAEIEERVRVVQAVSPDDIRLQLGNDAIVRWGNADEAAFKAEVLLALLPRRAQAYDVSAPQLPTTFGEKGRRN